MREVRDYPLRHCTTKYVQTVHFRSHPTNDHSLPTNISLYLVGDFVVLGPANVFDATRTC